MRPDQGPRLMNSEGLQSTRHLRHASDDCLPHFVKTTLRACSAPKLMAGAGLGKGRRCVPVSKIPETGSGAIASASSGSLDGTKQSEHPEANCWPYQTGQLRLMSRQAARCECRPLIQDLRPGTVYDKYQPTAEGGIVAISYARTARRNLS